VQAEHKSTGIQSPKQHLEAWPHRAAVVFEKLEIWLVLQKRVSHRLSSRFYTQKDKADILICLERIQTLFEEDSLRIWNRKRVGG